jgi:Histidine biosynthesis protein
VTELIKQIQHYSDETTLIHQHGQACVTRRSLNCQVPRWHFSKMTRFRPCIDLHAGEVKQIVGGTLDNASEALKTNFVSQHPSAHYSELYRDNRLTGAHVIMLGPGNDQAAREALKAWPQGLQVGGGISDGNTRAWLDAGAEKVTCYQLLTYLRLLAIFVDHNTLGYHHIIPLS